MRYENAITLSQNQQLTSEGYLICKDCTLATVGGRDYLAQELPSMTPDANGVVTVFRDSQELFSPETIASLEGKPVTLGHPDEILLTPETWKEHSVGDIHNVRQGEGDRSDSLLADLFIYAPEAIQAVREKTATELSLGMTSRTEETSAGRANEHDIRGNHVALVPRGRCGPACAVADQEPAKKGEKSMADENKNQGSAEEKKFDAETEFKALSEKVDALTEAVSKITEKQDKKDEDTAGQTEEKKADSKPVTAEQVVKIMTDMFAKQAENAKADAAVIKDAATVAPALSKDTPNLAQSALAEYAKADSGARFLQEFGGIGAVKADNAAAILKAAAAHVRLSADAVNSKGAEPKKDSQPKDFFAQAREMWGKK